MERIINWVISSAQQTDRGIYSVLTHLGLWVVPLAPAVVFGHSFYASIQGSVNPDLALLAGVAAAMALEIPGATSAHTALGLQALKAESWKVWTCWCLVAAYVLLGIGGVIGFEYNGGFTVVGVLVFLLMPIAYISLGFSRDLNRMIEAAKVANSKAEAEAIETRAKQDEIDRENRKFEHQRLLAEDDRRYQLALKQAEIAAQKEIETERTRAQAEIEIQKQRTKAEVQRTKRRLAEVEAEKQEYKAEKSEQSGERPAEYAERLAVIVDKSGGDSFGPVEVQEWTGLGKTAVYELLNYAKAVEDVHQAGRGKYETNGVAHR